VRQHDRANRDRQRRNRQEGIEVGDMGVQDARFQEAGEEMRAEDVIQAQDVRRGIEETTEHTQNCQHDQRDAHEGVALRRVMRSFCPRLPEEHHLDLPPHIEGGETGSDQQATEGDETTQIVQRAFIAEEANQVAIQQDFVFRPEPGEGEDTRQRQRTDHVGDEGDGHPFGQTAHIPHVLRVEVVVVRVIIPMCRSSIMSMGVVSVIVMSVTMAMTFMRQMMPVFDAMNDRTAAQEQKRFEERVRHQMEHGRRVGADARCRDHETELRDGRISQHALDVPLPHRHIPGG